jgi:SAM-dependent methyltransferase
MNVSRAQTARPFSDPTDPRGCAAVRAHERVDEFVQSSIAGTNGNLYIPLINRLTRYTIPGWPTETTGRIGGLLLDIGCGWGRWMIAAARAGFEPVGIDIKIESLQAARRVMKAHNVKGHVVLADLTALPFRTGAFDGAFSYSAIQHVSKQRAAACVAEAKRVIKNDSTCLIQLPLKHGLTNVRRLLKRSEGETDTDSWAVRYYSWGELRNLFCGTFGNMRVWSDCFCGIGVRPEDIDLLPWRYQIVVVASQILKQCTRVFPPFTRLSDAVFVETRKMPMTRSE